MLTVPGVTRVNEESCDIHDVTRAASDLVAAGCNIGMTHFPDGLTRLRFGAIVSSYVDEVIRAVDEGVISAWQGVQEISAQYEELSSKAFFYLQNGVGVVAGTVQLRSGIAVLGIPGGFGVVPGAFLVGHGTNNIYEGVGNIYHGPDFPSTVGPVRRMYRGAFRGSYEGDMAYYSMDLYLSVHGMYRQVPKSGALELFRRDPINYERAYKQAGKLALVFEAIVDFITMNSMLSLEDSAQH